MPRASVSMRPNNQPTAQLPPVVRQPEQTANNRASWPSGWAPRPVACCSCASRCQTTRTIEYFSYSRLAPSPYVSSPLVCPSLAHVGGNDDHVFCLNPIVRHAKLIAAYLRTQKHCWPTSLNERSEIAAVETIAIWWGWQCVCVCVSAKERGHSAFWLAHNHTQRLGPVRGPKVTRSSSQDHF